MREVGGRIVLMDFSGSRALDGASRARVVGHAAVHRAGAARGPRRLPARHLQRGRAALLSAVGLLAGDGGTSVEIRRRHASAERVRLRDLRPELPDAVVEIVERATEANPADASAWPAISSTRSPGIFAGHGALSRRPPPALPRTRASRAGWVLAIAAAIALAGSVAAWRYVPPRSRRARAPRPPVGRAPLQHGALAPCGSGRQLGCVRDDDRGRKVLWLHPLGSAQGHALKAAEDHRDGVLVGRSRVVWVSSATTS